MATFGEARPNAAARNGLSEVLLVACDQAYNPDILTGAALAPFGDSPTAGSSDVFPEAIPQEWHSRLTGWAVESRFDYPQTGFGATIYQKVNSDGSVDYIVAMQGTRGPNIQDWSGNLIFGWDKWSHLTVQGDPANPDPRTDFFPHLLELSSVNNIHFTGQSLGGALAQYALVDYANRLRRQHEESGTPDFDPLRVTLTTFNGLGGIAGLKNRSNASTSLVSEVDTAHFYVTNDLVSRLGEGNLNGAGNEYLLDFRKANDEGVVRVRPDNSRIALSLSTAHKIETGFYRGFNLAGSAAGNGFPVDFTYATQQSIARLDVAGLARTGTYLAWLTNQDGALETDVEAAARAIAALTVSIGFGDRAAFEKLVHAISENLYESNAISHFGRVLIDANAPKFLNAMAVSPAGLSSELAAQFVALVQEFSGSTGQVEVPSGFTARFAALVAGSGLPQSGLLLDPTVIGSRASTLLSDRHGLEKSVVLYGGLAAMGAVTVLLAAPSINNAALSTAASHIFDAVADDVAPFAATVLRESSQALGQQLGQADAAFSEALAAVSRGLLSSAVDVSRGAAGLSIDAKQFVDGVKDASASALADVARSLANAHSDLTLKFTDAFEWGVPVARRSLDKLIGVLVSEARADTAGTGLAFEEAIEVLETATQAVVVRAGRPSNPFDQDDFDSDAAPVTEGGLNEGSLSTFTVYLPYKAGAGGQRIVLRLAGDAADKLSVSVDGQVLELDLNGVYVLTVAEGQRQASFEILSLEDVDLDQAFTLSAQLVGASGEATHLQHEELRLALDAESEAAPAAVLEYRGDWNAKYYRRMNADGSLAVDDTGAPVYETRIDARYPHLSNVERAQDAPPADLPAYYLFGGVMHTAPLGHRMDIIRGHEAADGVWLGGGSGTSVAHTYGGDDTIYGSEVENIVLSGAGDDWVEGRGNPVQVAEGVVHQGREVRLGDDKIYGGAGNDTLYGESAATQDLLNDANQRATGLPGDWINGGTGNDRVYGSAGDDVLLGGIGADVMHGGAGMDVVLGDDNFNIAMEGNYWRVLHTNFDDGMFTGFEVGLFPIYNYAALLGGGLADTDPNIQDPYVTYYKHGGDDVLIGGAGKDILIGQAGDDTLYGGDDDDILAGWEGEDHIVGGDGDDKIAGDFGRYEQPSQRSLPAANVGVAGLVGSQAFNASLVAQQSNDYLDGGAGNDTIFGEGGDDVLMGHTGADTLYGDANYLPDELHGADILDGGAGNDALFGNAGNDRLFGGAADDVIDGGFGDDEAEGGIGNDSINGGDGDDVLMGGEDADLLEGGAGKDVLSGGSGNDHLVGGEGEDLLHGEAGADTLDAGAGDDLLYGGSGEDVLSGGEGNDRLDGGAGIDIARGGEGDDAYVLALGYGRDVIEDAQGGSRLVFGTGVTAEDLAVTVDSMTLTATITFSDIGDSVSFNAAEVGVAGVDFASGTSWGRKEFVGFMPAVVKLGSTAADVLSGVESLRNDLRGEGGADALTGSRNNDILAGGEDADILDGKSGADRYLYAAGETGIDRLSDSGMSGREYLEWFYASRGVADWQERSIHGGRFRAEGAGEGGSFVAYFDTYEEAFDQYSWATITFIEPLEEIAPLVTRNDQTMLANLVTAGILDTDVVGFGEGLALEDLTLTLTVDGAAANAHPEQPWYEGGTLSVRWDAAGFDVEVPSVTYALQGSNPSADIDGYRLGEGVEAFAFADGTTYSLEQILERAEVVRASAFTVQRGTEAFDFLEAVDGLPNALYGLGGMDVLQGGESADLLDGGQGADSLLGAAGDDRYLYAIGYGEDSILEEGQDGGSGLDTVAFLGEIRPDDVSLSQDYNALVVSLGGGDVLRLFGWFTEKEGTVERLEFADGTVWRAAEIEASLPARGEGTLDDDTLLGGTGDDLLQGLDGNDELHGNAGDDALDGGEGDDYLEGSGGNDIVRGGAGADDIEDWMGGNLLEGGEGDDYLYEEGRTFVIGGTGNDFIDHAGDNAVVAFNAGDGHDRIVVAGSLTLSLGAGIGPSSLALSQASEGLLLAIGQDESIMLLAEDSGAWPRITLQLFGSVHLYDFNAVIDAFYSAHADHSGLERFSLDGILQIHETDFSETEALGGAIAWQYATTGTTTALTDPQIRSVVADPGFGTEGQPLALGGAQNEAPTLETPIADQIVTEDMPFTLAVPSNTFSDPDGHALVLDVSLANGDTLPGWLSFEPETWTFTGRPENQHVGSITVRITAVDPEGASASDMFDVAVANVNDAPVVANAIRDQDAVAGQPLFFSFPANTFADADFYDAMIYSAALADGSALPSWLMFDASTRTFAGTPPLGGADDLSLAIRVTAADGAGAVAFDDFVLGIKAGREAGQLIVGTDANDVLTGTPSNDVIDGREGFDWMAGGQGNDIYFVDAMHSLFDLVIEQPNEGRDTVYSLADYRLAPNVEDVHLVGRKNIDATGNELANVLEGNEGNNWLSGGAGADTYVYGLDQGNDVIDENGVAGEADTLKLQDISAETIRLKRSHDDLVIDCPGRGGRITLKKWFASSASRIEKLEFDDGTEWDEADIRSRVGRFVTVNDREHYPPDHVRLGDDGRRSFGDAHGGRDKGSDQDRRHDDGKRIDGVDEAIVRRLKQPVRFDFEHVTRALANGSGGRTMTAQEIATRWAQVQGYTRSLDDWREDDEHDADIGELRQLFGVTVPQQACFGFEGSTGKVPGLNKWSHALTGLAEGFRRL